LISWLLNKTYANKWKKQCTTRLSLFWKGIHFSSDAGTYSYTVTHHTQYAMDTWYTVSA